MENISCLLTNGVYTVLSVTVWQLEKHKSKSLQSARSTACLVSVTEEEAITVLQCLHLIVWVSGMPADIGVYTRFVNKWDTFSVTKYSE